YSADHVNRLAYALKRQLHVPHQIVCITDNTDGLDFKSIYCAIPLHHTIGKRNGRRLWIFSDEARELLGSTVLQIDLDMVLTGDITPLVESFTANNRTFQIWKCKMSSRYR